MACQMLTLVLEDDGTVVDSEAFFQSLPNNTPFMVLEKGEVWTPSKRVQQWHILIILMNKICYWLTVSPLTKSVIFTGNYYKNCFGKYYKTVQIQPYCIFNKTQILH